MHLLVIQVFIVAFAISQSLPTVDLGYEVHRAIALNVLTNPSTQSSCAFADISSRHPGAITISPISPTQSLPLAPCASPNPLLHNKQTTPLSTMAASSTSARKANPSSMQLTPSSSSTTSPRIRPLFHSTNSTSHFTQRVRRNWSLGRIRE